MNTAHPTDDAVHIDLSHVDEALNAASYELDKFIYSAQRQCGEAVFKVCRGGWARAGFSLDPLVTVYLAAAGQLVVLPEVEDPVCVLDALLDICVARTQQAMEHPAMFDVSGLTPAGLLAAQMSFVSGVFLSHYAGD